MFTSRTAARASRVIKAPRHQFQPRRFESSQNASVTQSKPASSGAISGGIAGAATAALLGYAWYHFSGTKTLVGTAKQGQAYIQEAQAKFKEQVQDKAPNPNEALRWLRQVTTYYAGFLPGASGIVNSTFDDLDKIREKHGDEVDKIVSQAYEELKGVSNKGMSLQTAQQGWEVLQKHIQQILELASDAAEDIINNHPQLKQAVGGNIQKLKQYGEAYGPEAKKQYEETKDQIKDVMKGGISSDTVNKLRKLIEEKVQQVQKMGDDLWNKGMESLSSNPKAKELLENSKDALKQGNVAELFEKAKNSSSEDLQKYVDQAKEKASKASGGGVDQYMKMIPGGDQIFSRLGQLQDVAKAKGPEAQKLLESTMKELSDVLSKKSEEAKKLGGEAKKEAK